MLLARIGALLGVFSFVVPAVAGTAVFVFVSPVVLPSLVSVVVLVLVFRHALLISAAGRENAQCGNQDKC